MTTDSKLDAMMARHRAVNAEYARSELARASDTIVRFTELATKKGIALNSSSFEYVQTIGIVAKSPGIARALLGPMKSDRDGLLSYNDITRKMPTNQFQNGYFSGPNFMLMAHPCFRRQMHPDNNWAPRFVDRFWEFDEPNVEKYVAIDEDRVRVNVDDSYYLEFDTWYGAPFDEDVQKIKSGLVKLRPPSDLDATYIDFLFANSYCLDIKWSEANGIKTFQALEIKTDDIQIKVDGRIYFPARYLHAEFDISANCFRHFDGAIQYFLEEEYRQRRDSDFNMGTKDFAHIKARSKKVFKLNGSLTTKNWVDLCCHFYTANPLTFEYFTGAYPAHTTDALARIRALPTTDA